MAEKRIGKPYYGERSWFRKDLDMQTGEFERFFVDGPEDLSPIYRHWEDGKYNSQCSCCWLGFGHTEAYHFSRIRK